MDNDIFPKTHPYVILNAGADNLSEKSNA